MDIIRLLPDSVANQIAAGEVIQRPASVVKELVENAIDAGADNIQIIIADAGRTLIQVIDNGSGMSDTDARMAFERHATSKISQAADLFSLHTMGFRGEALASIAAVAQIELRTRRREDTLGSRLIINGSRLESQEADACSAGSNMMVKNLFFNVPARRRFLKKDAVEIGAIMREFERLALVNPEVEFTLVHNDTTLHSLLRGSLKQRIVSLFGKALDKQLIPVDTDTSIVKISGFIGLPSNARRRNPLQYFFVNGRNMRHPYFHKAVLHCYEMLIAPDEQPNYFLNFSVDPASIDVNIHPTKSEIKFEDEAAVWQILVAAIKEALGRYNATPGIDFDLEDAPEIPFFDPNAQSKPQVDFDPAYNPFATPEYNTPTPSAGNKGGGQSGRSSNPNLAHWEKLFDDFTQRRDQGLNIDPSSLDEGQGSALNSLDTPALPALDDHAAPSSCMQLKGRYLLTPSKSGLMVIDQHRAHTMVIYHSILDSTRDEAIPSQQLIFPEPLELAPSQSAILTAILPEIERMGFAIQPPDTLSASWTLTGSPSALGNANPSDTLLRIIETVEESGEDPSTHLRERIALTMARSAAIKAGTTLNSQEIEHLISSLLSLPAPSYTPDGLTTLAIIQIEDIVKLLE
ncbi:MAG: DNA mismatch repair endonuclease MutL [Bacteroidales bacterium]|nr:DNA mismatch repair endonuclease MutL [Bacteroidales bacterium]